MPRDVDKRLWVLHDDGSEDPPEDMFPPQDAPEPPQQAESVSVDYDFGWQDGAARRPALGNMPDAYYQGWEAARQEFRDDERREFIPLPRDEGMVAATEPVTRVTVTGPHARALSEAIRIHRPPGVTLRSAVETNGRVDFLFVVHEDELRYALEGEPINTEAQNDAAWIEGLEEDQDIPF